MPVLQRLPRRRRASSAASRVSASASARRSAINSSERFRPGAKRANMPRIRSAASRRRTTSDRVDLVACAIHSSYRPPQSLSGRASIYEFGTEIQPSQCLSRFGNAGQRDAAIQRGGVAERRAGSLLTGDLAIG
jgi:hypothetical protein